MIDMTLAEREQVILSELKDFQRATADRCFDLFRSGQRRVLVADEVGLGKTLVARGVIAKLANYHKHNGDKLFKVLYICSNASIADQNIRKLKIYEGVTVDRVYDTRLSMQHLKICERENDPLVKEGFVQLIPLTPATSFNVTNRSGLVEERALIFAILKRLDIFSGYEHELEHILQDGAGGFMKWARVSIEQRVLSCDSMTNGMYTRETCRDVLSQLDDALTTELLTLCEDVRAGMYDARVGRRAIRRLRFVFAQVSINRLHPDLVIMDEFQRFRELITAPEDSETGLLTKAFLEGKYTDTLLLSATPYKLYQTLEEAAERGIDEHYQEFFELMRFLFNDTDRINGFERIWGNFSESLHEMTTDFGTLIRIKNNAETEMYSSICRTERLLVKSKTSLIDDSLTKVPLSVSKEDILSYIEASKVDESIKIPVEYIKSCPYVLSFMEHYKYKDDLRKVKPKFTRLARKLLFIDEQRIHSFRQLSLGNARLNNLMDIAFNGNTEKLLWIPPSIPYYQPGGAYRGKEKISKILVFSAWDMVPRMIACTLSYECERRTIGKLYEQEPDKRNKGYLAETERTNGLLRRKARPRYPYRKLTENRIKPLITASEVLANIYNPIEHMGESLSVIKQRLKSQIVPLLSKIKKDYDIPERGIEDPDWFWKAPLLFDDLSSEIKKKKPLCEEIPKRKMPKDIDKVLVDMAIASPAICAMRIFGMDRERSEEFAREVANMFDKPEAIAVVELVYGKDNEAHYKNVLKYCVDGNFAAMLDEYKHILNDKDPKSLCDQMCAALKATTASYSVETFASFSGNKESQIRMRSHFAAGFYQTQGDEKTSQRKENLRIAFDAPFRPFVLATTSIGQEGLDFHNYTRKIMHWNLPHNPVDIEQREGRINRYKCLAIRQSLAKEYGKYPFRENVWDEVFQYALIDKADNDPELIPYWCLPDGGSVKIERIVPMYPYSKDKAIYSRLLKILSLYRVTLGHARQEELLEYLFNNCTPEEMKELFIDLSPYSKLHRKAEP